MKIYVTGHQKQDISDLSAHTTLQDAKHCWDTTGDWKDKGREWRNVPMWTNSVRNGTVFIQELLLEEKTYERCTNCGSTDHITEEC